MSADSLKAHFVGGPCDGLSIPLAKFLDGHMRDQVWALSKPLDHIATRVGGPPRYSTNDIYPVVAFDTVIYRLVGRGKTYHYYEVS